MKIRRIACLFLAAGGSLATLTSAQDVGPRRPPASGPASQPSATTKATAAEIDALIEKAGKEAPDWWNSTPLNYPKTLDLTWGKPVGPFDPNKNIGQYLMAQLNPNPSRHREGCKFLQYVYTQNKGNTAAQLNAAQTLGQYYGLLLSDWARGAYWYRKAQELGALAPPHAANLARCYYRLGNKELAAGVLEKAGWSVPTVRELCAIGDATRALQLARDVSPKEYGSLLTGDICRYIGNWKDALASYTQSASSGTKNTRILNIARGGVDAIPSFQKVDLDKIADGSYTGDCAGGFRGSVRAQVTVKAHRITAAKVIDSKEDWPLNALLAIPAQIIEKQSVKGIDTVTGATFTSDAVLDALAKALASGVK